MNNLCEIETSVTELSDIQHPMSVVPSAELAPSAAPTAAAERQSVKWSLPHRLIFRWAFCYFLLYTLPSAGRVTLVGFLPAAYMRMWQPIVIWVATHIFHVTGHAATYFPTGSGDTTLGYVENFCDVVLAFAGTLIWSAVDRKRANYSVLHSWFRVWIRFTLAATVMSYGFAKVFPLQMAFYFPTVVERWGDFSPMGALWSFMAASRPYGILAGAAEVLGGVLLLWRRTTLLGAVICFGVMFNVAALNYCYDVPVKLYSTNLVLMSVFLMAPDLRRLARIFLLNQPAAAANLDRPDFSRPWMSVARLRFSEPIQRRLRLLMRIAALFCKCALIWYMADSSWMVYRYYYGQPPGPGASIYGFYEVETFKRNDAAAPPLLTDSSRWRYLYVQADRASVTLMNDKRVFYGIRQNIARSSLTLTNGQANYSFSYSSTDPKHLVLDGKMGDDKVEVALHKLERSDFLLLNRGFHWISEYPFNR